MTSSAKIPKRQASSKDDPEQSRLFIEKAREIGADKGGALPADKLIAQLAKKPPDPRQSGSEKKK
jgi:hypothetical protein